MKDPQRTLLWAASFVPVVAIARGQPWIVVAAFLGVPLGLGFLVFGLRKPAAPLEPPAAVRSPNIIVLHASVHAAGVRRLDLEPGVDYIVTIDGSGRRDKPEGIS